MKYDFGGYATRNDLKCSDGRTIRKDAFKDCDGKVVPIVWQHVHNDSSNVLGHGVLENREDGVYIYGSLNNTQKGKDAKEQIRHGDITFLSIWANNISENDNGDVFHGDIKEVSLVLAGANPGATIDNISFAHADGSVVNADDEAIITTGVPISLDDVEHAEEGDPAPNPTPEPVVSHAAGEGKTMRDVFNGMTDEQKNVVYAMLAYMEGVTLEQSELTGGITMKKNIFDGSTVKDEGTHLSHSQIQEIFDDAEKMGSLKKSIISHAATYGIENIDVLFPDAKTVTPTPDMIKRDTEWVNIFLNGARHVPFSRIKSTAADITADEARARGYIKGNLKKEEVIKVMKRITTPTTVYKKQKLDRDDIIDITDFQVVSWIKAEMRVMLNEEVARAGLLGDGRDPEEDADDKINEENIRPIYSDDDLYAHHLAIDAETVTTEEGVLDAIVEGMENYEGTGTPIMFTTRNQIIKWKLLKDKVGRKLFATEDDLASYLGVSRLVPVPVMKGMQRVTEEGETPSKVTTTYDLVGIIVNPADYTYGADKGGEISMFDDFDIDYNQYKYLLETRTSGCLTHPKSALVVEKYTKVTS